MHLDFLLAKGHLYYGATISWQKGIRGVGGLWRICPHGHRGLLDTWFSSLNTIAVSREYWYLSTTCLGKASNQVPV